MITSRYRLGRKLFVFLEKCSSGKMTASQRTDWQARFGFGFQRKAYPACRILAYEIFVSWIRVGNVFGVITIIPCMNDDHDD
mmetsp:Transcript_11149/g.23086  ORF Transcript_11149/g.23086 Transcript_11149/m.23086 type:complete len:82 (-) Transcript_11149:1296-1541(-)